jgi:predicted S18 family serine protease
MRKRAVLIVMAILILAAAAAFAQMEDGVDVNEGNIPAKDAEAPEKVYIRYARAVHGGDIPAIRTMVYSRSLLLWDKNGKQMLGMTKNSIPASPELVGRKPVKESQYHYMVLTMRGTSSKGLPMTGEVKMIVEKSQWRVYSEIWRPAR